MRVRVAAVLLGLALLLSACGGGGTGDTPPAALAPPTDLTAVAGNGEVALGWQASASEGIVRYNVYQGTSSGDLSKVADLDGDTLSHPVSGLSNGTKYFFAVDAEDSGGRQSAKSNEVNATPTGADPGGPDPGGPASPPTVISTSPADGAAGIGTNSNITVMFSKPMDEVSTEAAFSIDPTVTCDFLWGSVGKRLTCDPAGGLDPSETYTVTIDTGAQDTNGNSLAASEEFTFKTGLDVAETCAFGTSTFGQCTFGP